MIISGSILFDSGVAAQGLGSMGDPGHGDLCLVSNKVLYSSAKPNYPTPVRVPDGISVSISGLCTSLISKTLQSRVKIGVGGWWTYTCHPPQGIVAPLPDAEGFYICLSIDGQFAIETIQVDWIAFWN